MWEFEPFLWWNWKQSTTKGGAHHLNGRNGETVKLEAHFVYGRNSLGEKQLTSLWLLGNNLTELNWTLSTGQKESWYVPIRHLSQSDRPKNTSMISSWAVPTHICVLTFSPLRTGFLENRRECVFSEGGGGLTHLSWSVSPGWSVQHLSSPHYSSNDIFKSLKVRSLQPF